MRSGKIGLFLLCLLPLIWVLYLGVSGELGPDPGKALVLVTGGWAIRLLLITLAVSPLQKVGWKGVVRYRRLLGLFSYFYASLHFLAVFTYLLGWSAAVFVEEFAERPYMALGITAWLLMIPLAITSNRYMIRRLGRRWRQLHGLVYIVAVMACAHFIWLVRSNYAEALIYSVILAMLILLRKPLQGNEGVRSLVR